MRSNNEKFLSKTSFSSHRISKAQVFLCCMKINSLDSRVAILHEDINSFAPACVLFCGNMGGVNNSDLIG